MKRFYFRSRRNSWSWGLPARRDTHCPTLMRYSHTHTYTHTHKCVVVYRCVQACVVV